MRNLQAGQRLEQAVESLSAAWLPMNPVVVRQLQRIVEKAPLRENKREFIETLRADFPLFGFFVRELRATLKSRTSLSASTTESLLDLCSEDEIQSVLLRAAKMDCGRPLSAATSEQTLQLRDSIVSISASYSLCHFYNVEPDLAYTCSLFRQLGLTLVAWNFPHIFQHAHIMAAQLPPSANLKRTPIENALHRLLGYSPMMLALSIARKFDLPLEVRLGLGESIPSHIGADSKTALTAAVIEKICEIGEIFAHASAPDRYPTALSTWEICRDELTPILGKDGLIFLREQSEQALTAYAKALPQMSEPQLPDTITEHIVTPDTDRFTQNTYIPYCPVQLQNTLREVYNELSPTSVSKEIVRKLTNVIIPSIGFNRGCIYLLEPDTMMLVPRMAIGETRLNELRPLNFHGISDRDEPATIAYRSRAPIMEEDTVITGRTVSYVAGALGDFQRAGVLYLEMSPALIDSHEANPILFFKALRQTLMDSLNLV